MTPPSEDALVELFVGPTAHGLPAQLVRQDGVRLRPPARRGHIDALIAHEPPGHIALVDGRYDDVPAVGHRELLGALAAGWAVTGLGSIGALRAAELHPHLVPRYERLYAEGAYAPKWYQRRITRQVHELAQEYGIGPARAGTPRRIAAPEPAVPPAHTASPASTTPGPTQLTLL
ncbi:TfuA-like protein [Streptomyces sp. NPDC086182]|uniref:TfuA-like protein n=1 Tax=Streptomyces sp. NPDC086182 TaxID=3155058 RepID=UPI00343D81D2